MLRAAMFAGLEVTRARVDAASTLHRDLKVPVEGLDPIATLLLARLEAEPLILAEAAAQLPASMAVTAQIVTALVASGHIVHHDPRPAAGDDALTLDDMERIIDALRKL